MITNSKNTFNSPRATAIGMTFFILVTIWFVASNVHINSDMQQFLPENSETELDSSIDPVKVLNVISEANSGVFFLAIEGGNDKQRAAASIKLRKKLLKDKSFIFVNNGSGRLPKKDRAIVNKYRYLLSGKNNQQKTLTSDLFSQENLENSFKLRYQELVSPLGSMFKKSIASDPTAEVRFILKQWQTGKEPVKAHSVWVSQNESSALLVAGINIKGADINTQQMAVDVIKKTFSEINTQKLTLSISGTGVFAVQSRDKIKADSQRISVVASVAVMLLIFIAFKSYWFVFLAVVPLLSAILSGVIATQLIFGSIQGITLAFGLTLIGVGLDYPVHIFSHIVKGEKIIQSIKNIWPTMRLGVITTSLGFLSLTQTNFNGLAQLGVFAISGLLVAALVSRYAMPNLILMRPVKIVENIPAWVGRLCQISIPFNIINVTAIIGVAAILIFNFPVQWENDLAKLSPISSEQLELDARLRKDLNTDDLVNVAIIKATNSNAAIRGSETLAEVLDQLITNNTIAGYRSPHHLLPSKETQILRQQNLPNTKLLEQRVSKAIQNSNFSANSFSRFIGDVEKSKALMPLDVNKLKGTLFGRQLSSMLYQQQDDWFAVIRFIDVKDPLVLKRTIKNLENHDIAYVNIKQVSQSIIDDFRNEAVNLITLGLVVIFFTLLFSLRDRQRLIRICLIVSMALVFDVVLLNMLGQALSLFHLISLLLVMGLGLDYSLFFTRSNDNKAMRERTAYGMLVCFGSTALVFGMLASSSMPVLSAIGMTVSIGVSLCFILATLFSEKQSVQISA